jgi:hypothetical protein
LLLAYQKKQFEYQMKLQLSKYRQRESEFQQLREQFVSLQSSQSQKNLDSEKKFEQLKTQWQMEREKALRLAQELAMEKGSVQERAKALEWDLQ